MVTATLRASRYKWREHRDAYNLQSISPASDPGRSTPPRNQFTFDHNSLRLLMGRSKRVTVSGVLLLLGYVTIFASPSLSNESGFFTASSAREEFIQFLPSDCEYMAESSVIGSRSFFLIQPCHRGGGALLKEIPKVVKIKTGIIYIPKQSLSDGRESPSGFWCSRKAKRSGSSFSMLCTRYGWRASPP